VTPFDQTQAAFRRGFTGGALHVEIIS
jgi:hypothetical protein